MTMRLMTMRSRGTRHYSIFDTILYTPVEPVMRGGARHGVRRKIQGGGGGGAAGRTAVCPDFPAGGWKYLRRGVVATAA